MANPSPTRVRVEAAQPMSSEQMHRLERCYALMLVVVVAGLALAVAVLASQNI